MLGAHFRACAGYSRNARRGVTDEYSLKLSDKLISDYNAVITDLKKSDDIIDTRAADGFENYMSSEILIPFGVYLLLFSIFSSEIQSGRIKSFGISKTGVRKFSLFKLCTRLCCCNNSCFDNLHCGYYNSFYLRYKRL